LSTGSEVKLETDLAKKAMGIPMQFQAIVACLVEQMGEKKRGAEL
jgi:hypothetical protein